MRRGAHTPRAAHSSLGLAACTAIVIGNMVGPGFYLSPAAVAPYGRFAIVWWVVIGAGAACLGLTFAKLARIAPVIGGPYAYTRLAYGDVAGFVVAWGYWISIWSSLPVMAVAFTGSLIKLVPALQGSRPVAIFVTLAAIWVVALINLRGVWEAGLFAAITTYARLLPFAAIALAGLAFVRVDHIGYFPAGDASMFGAGAALAPLTMFSFLGLESATVPAGDVRDPARTIPRATMLGIVGATLLYVLGTVVVLGVVPPDQLVASMTPFADVAQIMWGPRAATAIAIAVVLSSLGALNGWTLLMGQVPMAAAGDHLFPAVFGHVSRRGVPAIGIVMSAGLATVLVLVGAAAGETFAALYGLVVSLSTMTAVVAYVFCALAPGLIATRTAGRRVPRIGATDLVALLFALLMVYTCGRTPILYGFALLMLGIPVYAWQRRMHGKRVAAAR